MTIDYHEGYQVPKDPYSGYDPIIETMRELHRIALKNWLVALQAQHPSRRLVTQPVTTQGPHFD